MAIKDPILFITVEEFKNSKYFNNLLFDKVTTPDNEIWFAISVASSNIDYLSGFTISKKWPEITPTDFTDNIQTATTHYVRFLLTKDVDYLRGQGSISQGGLTYSETNPDDPYFIPPEVFNCLRKIKEYPNLKGFNLKGIESQKNNWFNKFISNCGEDSPLNAYIPYNNIKSLDSRTKITITHSQNMLRPIVNIDTTGINTSTTIPEFKSPKETIDIKYYESNHTVNADISNKIQNEIDKKQNKSETVFIWKSSVGASGKYDGGGYLSMSNKQITSLGTPTSPSDATTKQYVDDKIPNLTDYYKKEETDNKLLLKQDKLTAGENIKIENNVISATGSTDLTDYYKKAVFMKGYFTYKDDRDQLWINDSSNSSLAISLLLNNRYDRLETTNKTIAGAINEILEKQPNIPKWKEVGTKININHIKYTFKSNTKYKIYYNFENQSSNKKIAFICKEFLYGELNNDVQTLDWDKVNDRIMVSLQMQNDTIAIVSDPTRFGQLLKLEELQE
ncbi:hypothetical protein [Spiroplasma endosymbiont of Zeiraphera isertana]|uniref:hypothetical protein n=1 Tax=Spiroplasma endosymbiont of Zeiraphera isertana TaxID=3066313 RepID=UPI00313B57BD